MSLAGRQNPLYACRHDLTTPASDPDRCACISMRVEVLDQLVWSQVRAALTTPTPSTAPGTAGHSQRRRPPETGPGAVGSAVGSAAGSGPSLDIGADTLTARITATAEDIAALQATIAAEYRAARADGFDPATARLMLAPRRDQLTHAQATLELLHRVRTTLTPTAPRDHPDRDADRDALQRARVRLEDLDTDGKQQLLDLLGVQAEVTGYHPCPTCAGTGYAPIPPGSQRHWPPSCPACHRLKVLPDVTVDIGHAHLLLAQPGTGRDAQSAG